MPMERREPEAPGTDRRPLPCPQKAGRRPSGGGRTRRRDVRHYTGRTSPTAPACPPTLRSHRHPSKKWNGSFAHQGRLSSEWGGGTPPVIAAMLVPHSPRQASAFDGRWERSPVAALYSAQGHRGIDACPSARGQVAGEQGRGQEKGRSGSVPDRAGSPAPAAAPVDLPNTTLRWAETGPLLSRAPAPELVKPPGTGP
jgi:hypothetical protein